MLKVACLPSHPLEKLVARKKRRGSEAVYEALLPPPCSHSTRLVATLIQKKMYKVELPAVWLTLFFPFGLGCDPKVK
ncbi:hypothetical protein SLEP1_g59765 [Rubroshorea leprosula]|uniref:Uncharacterized protein n=1 Tax=Rubroshorea leprosula TaxID=152421 RepID=A0AAV5MUG7_9ROSI|nr:hypothetical protein SLEP1_g59765 [Rubroshorea leprosula]